MNSFAVVNHWLHLVSVIIWIGGNAFQVFFLIPFIKPEDPSHGLLLKISRRFTKISLLSLLVLVITGGMNFGVRRAGYEEIPPGYISALAVKVFLIVGLAAFPLFSLIRPADEDHPDKIPSLIYAKMSLAVGLIIVFIAAMLRQWQF